MSTPRWNTERATRLGNIITQTRLEQNLTQDQLAEQAGLSMPTISAVERTGNGRQSSISAILEALGLDPSVAIGPEISLNNDRTALVETIAPAVNPEIQRLEGVIQEMVESHATQIERIQAKAAERVNSFEIALEWSNERAMLLDDIVNAVSYFEIVVPPIANVFDDNAKAITRLNSAYTRLAAFDDRESEATDFNVDSDSPKDIEFSDEGFEILDDQELEELDLAVAELDETSHGSRWHEAATNPEEFIQKTIAENTEPVDWFDVPAEQPVEASY